MDVQTDASVDIRVHNEVREGTVAMEGQGRGTEKDIVMGNDSEIPTRGIRLWRRRTGGVRRWQSRWVRECRENAAEEEDEDKEVKDEDGVVDNEDEGDDDDDEEDNGERREGAQVEVQEDEDDPGMKLSASRYDYTKTELAVADGFLQFGVFGINTCLHDVAYIPLTLSPWFSVMLEQLTKAKADALSSSIATRVG